MQVKKKKKKADQTGKIPEEAERMKPYSNEKTRLRKKKKKRKKEGMRHL